MLRTCVVKRGAAFEAKAHLAANSACDPYNLPRVQVRGAARRTRYGHEIQNFTDAARAQKPRQQNIAVGQIHLAQPPFFRGCELTETAFRIVQQRSEDAGGIEARQTTPVDCAVHRNQRHRVHVSDNAVCFDWLIAHADNCRVKSFTEYEALAAAAHGHICAGQILGLRMAIYGMELLGINDPAGADRKRVVTYVEIDRCATDAITVVTGCRLGKRALKFRDFGKMAATFCDLKTDTAVRVVARESSKERAKELYPEIVDKNIQQMTAYRDMPAGELFASQWVRVEVGPAEMPGYKSSRRVCAECGEGINFERFVEREGAVLCRGCAGERYYVPV